MTTVRNHANISTVVFNDSMEMVVKLNERTATDNSEYIAHKPHHHVSRGFDCLNTFLDTFAPPTCTGIRPSSTTCVAF